jgi:hypothetical protein
VDLFPSFRLLQDECSFVSLRDVERVLEVMSWFYRQSEDDTMLFQKMNTTLCDEVCQRLVTGRWFSQETAVSITNKTDRHDITEMLLKVALNIINQTNL